MRVHVELRIPTKDFADEGVTLDELADFFRDVFGDEFKRLLPHGSSISVQLILDT